jgi:cytochrome c peroxidase
MKLRSSCLLLLSLATACGGEAISPRDLGLAAARMPAGTAMPQADAIDLGRHLFFDPRLSASGKMSCATCHQPDKAWTDGKKVSPKDNGSDNKWNTPSMANVAYLDKLYWDGRSPGLLATVEAAWKGQMGGDPEAIATKLAGVKGYAPMFQAAYGEGVTATNIAKAMAAFLTSLQSGNSPYDRWKVERVQDALTTQAKLGHDLFMGKAACHVCHQPPLFTDRTFHNAGIGQEGDAPEKGRGAHDPAPMMQGAFKTPSLRNVALTAPYFHDGSAQTLEEAVRYMASGAKANPHLDVQFQDRRLTDTEIDQLVAFLNSLTGIETVTAPQLPN